MSELTASKELLPDEWWAVAECVDAYEADSRDSFPDLRKYAQRAKPEFRAAALVELAKVDLERRWNSGDHRRVEDYLQEYPELGQSGDSLTEIVQQEFALRSKSGETASADELRSRFPKLDERRVLHADEYLLNTIAFGVAPDETQDFDNPADVRRTGTVMFDSKRVTGSSPLSIGSGSSGTVDFSTSGPIAKSGAAGSTPGASARSNSQDAETVGDSSVGKTAASQSASGNPAAVTASQASSAPKPKESIGRYSIQRTLGSGSFGMVYHCFDEDLKREVALKVPHGSSGKSSSRIKEFLHEAQIAARLKHPGIVAVLDTSQTAEGRVFIVYEFIPGDTLQNHLEGGKYTYADAARWMAEVGEALHDAHKHSIVHRDIKPANILVDKEDKTHIADFGLAKLDDQFFKDDTGRVLGTVAYMSPEQAAGQSHWATPQTDIYSLGVMFYQFLTHRLPFSSAGTATEVLEQIKHRVPPPPRTIDDRIPPALEEVCLKAMAKSPADRYRTAGDMAADLRTAIAGAPPSRRGLWIAIAAAGAAAVIGLMILAPWRKHDESLTTGKNGIVINAPPGTALVSAGGMLVPVKLGDLQLNLPKGTPFVEVLHQYANESGITNELVGNKIVPHERDKLQFHVHTADNQPKYLYLYWYDADGSPTRLWPLENAPLDHQKTVAEIADPPAEDEWRTIDATRGAEMVLAFVRDTPMTASELADFEKQRPYATGENENNRVYEFGSKALSAEISRGLGAIVKSRKNPISPEFEKKLQDDFSAYAGLVIPHQ